MNNSTRLTFWTVALASLLCGIFNCGEIASSDDAGEAGADAASDAPQGNCASESFGAAIAIDGLNTSQDERGLRFTPDELFGVFSRKSQEDADVTPPDIYGVSRTELGSDLTNAQVILATNGIESYPSIANDRSYLYFESPVCPSVTAGNDFLCEAPASIDGGYDILAGEPIFANDSVSLDYFHGFVTADAAAYYFTSRIEPDGGFDEYSYGATETRPDAGTRQQVVFVANAPLWAGPAPTKVASDPTLLLDNPVISQDELTLFVSTTSGSDPTPHIQMATRTSTSSSFGPITPVHELDSAEGEYPTWISSDLCRLYITRTVNGQTDLYVALRP